MSAESILIAIQTVSDALPFEMDDYDQVNRTFSAGAELSSNDVYPDVDVWTYCYVSRFFALKFVRSRHPTSADLDRLIDQVFVRIRRGSSNLRTPGRYTSWVNTVCRNAYLNYLRSYKMERLDDPENIVSESHLGEAYDVSLVTEALISAIDELNIRTGQPIANLRSYANKALRRLRKNPRLREIHQDWMLAERPTRVDQA
jgi:hypothetical protein